VDLAIVDLKGEKEKEKSATCPTKSLHTDRLETVGGTINFDRTSILILKRLPSTQFAM